MAVRLSASRAGRALLPRNIFSYSFLSEAESIPGPSSAERIRKFEKFSNLIGIPTHDVPACSVVPQPTTLPRATKTMPSKMLQIVTRFFFPNKKSDGGS
jgi:hypothetical protein